MTPAMIEEDHPNPTADATWNGPDALDEVAMIEASHRLLVGHGLSSVEAGNVVALVTGLHPAECGWTVEEITHLVFLHSFVVEGFIDPEGSEPR
jgi:hypothetical protein